MLEANPQTDRISRPLRTSCIIIQLYSESSRLRHKHERFKCPRILSNGHLRSIEIALRRGEIPGQQFVNAINRMVGDPFEHTAEVELRIETVQSCRSQQRIDRSSAIAARIRTTEQVILSAQGYCTQCPLGGRIVYFDPAIVEIACERTPARQCITNRCRRI